MSVSGGGGESSNKARQMNAEERAAIFNGGRSLLDSSIPEGSERAQYSDPGAYQGAPQAKTLSGGDYDRLEQSIVDSRMAPINRQMALDRESTDQSLADRGIYSSGLAIRAQNDLSERYAPQIAAAGAEAAGQRYNLEAGENQGVNQYNLANTQAGNSYNLQNSAGANAFSLQDTAAANDADWRKADYLQGLYNQTGGTVSSGKSWQSQQSI